MSKQDSRTQADKLPKAETDDRAEAFDAALRGVAEKSHPKVCPECGHVFQGNGWDGIDAHWKAKHDHIMQYGDAWPLIKAGTYKAR